MSIRHVVAAGDCIDSIAARYGFSPMTLWDLPGNSALRELRKDPHILSEGDVVLVPELRPGTVRLATGMRHRFKRKGVPARLALRLVDGGTARAGLEYELIVDGLSLHGATDEGGWLEHWVSPEAKTATLVISDTERYDVLIGSLEPLDTDEGVRARLRNLGYLAGGADDDAAFHAAVRAFQAASELDATGEVTDAVRQALLEAHRS